MRQLNWFGVAGFFKLLTGGQAHRFRPLPGTIRPRDANNKVDSRPGAGAIEEFLDLFD